MNKDSLNTSKWRNGKSMSFMNGVDSINGHEFKKATVYIGGNLKLGSNEKDGNAGSYFTMGTTYIGGDLLDYCNRANSYYSTAIWAYNHSNTFIGGDCFGGAGIAAGNNSIFMVGGDYQSKRATKINIEMFTYNAVDATYYSFCDDKHSYHADFDKNLTSTEVHISMLAEICLIIHWVKVFGLSRCQQYLKIIRVTWIFIQIPMFM